MPELMLDGGRLRYLEHAAAGAGSPTVVLLHGLGSCGEDWAFQVPALSPGYRILAPDLPGHGGSSLPPGWPTIGDLAGGVAELIERRVEGSAHLVGLSLGGAVALQLAVDRPEQVRSLTAVNAFARLRPAGGGWRRGAHRTALALAGRMDELGRRVAEGLFPEPAQALLRQAAAARIAANPRGNYLRLLAAIARFDLRRRLSDIAVPTLIVAGECDRTVAMAAKLELAGHIPRARLEVVPASGHVTPIDAPEAFNIALLGFLDEVDDREAAGARRPPAEGNVA